MAIQRPDPLNSSQLNFSDLRDTYDSASGQERTIVSDNVAYAARRQINGVQTFLPSSIGKESGTNGDDPWTIKSVEGTTLGYSVRRGWWDNVYSETNDGDSKCYIDTLTSGPNVWSVIYAEKQGEGIYDPRLIHNEVKICNCVGVADPTLSTSCNTDPFSGWDSGKQRALGYIFVDSDGRIACIQQKETSSITDKQQIPDGSGEGTCDTALYPNRQTLEIIDNASVSSDKQLQIFNVDQATVFKTGEKPLSVPMFEAESDDTENFGASGEIKWYTLDSTNNDAKNKSIGTDCNSSGGTVGAVEQMEVYNFSAGTAVVACDCDYDLLIRKPYTTDGGVTTNYCLDYMDVSDIWDRPRSCLFPGDGVSFGGELVYDPVGDPQNDITICVDSDCVTPRIGWVDQTSICLNAQNEIEIADWATDPSSTTYGAGDAVVVRPNGNGDAFYLRVDCLVGGITDDICHHCLPDLNSFDDHGNGTFTISDPDYIYPLLGCRTSDACMFARNKVGLEANYLGNDLCVEGNAYASGLELYTPDNQWLSGSFCVDTTTTAWIQSQDVFIFSDTSSGVLCLDAQHDLNIDWTDNLRLNGSCWQECTVCICDYTDSTCKSLTVLAKITP